MLLIDIFFILAYGDMVICADAAPIQGKYGESGTIIFVVNASVPILFKVILINNSINDTLAYGYGNHFMVNSNFSDKLKGRTVVSYCNNRYNITITNLQFTDEFQILAKAWGIGRAWGVGPLITVSGEAFSSFEVFGKKRLSLQY